jgi:tetratricopeptide (TPR) repeat protein
MERYPENAPLGLEDFRRSDWKAALSSAERDGYPGMWNAFRSSAQSAVEAGKLAEGRILWLLADACSMMLRPKSINEPFKPIMEWGNKRSALPDDFSKGDIIFLSNIVEEIENVWLRARIADLLWVVKHSRGPRFALLAIDAYRLIPLDKETWFRGGQDCWERAMQLAAMLRAGAGDRLNDIQTALVTALENATLEQGFFALSLARVLMKQDRPEPTQSAIVARKLEDLFRLSQVEGQLSQAMKYSEAAANWYQKAKDTDKAIEMTICCAEEYAKQAMARMSSGQGGGIAAMHFLEEAIQKYRTVPKVARASHKIDERIAELRRQKTIAGEKSLGEMTTVSSESIDIGQLVARAKEAGQGKSVLEALAAFVTVATGARVDQLRQISETNLREYPLQHFFPATHLSRDGRVIAKHDSGAEDSEQAMRARMVQNYLIEIGLSVRGLILPALEILHLEHRLRDADFIEIASRSPIVPPGRQRLVGKALYAGYDTDFASALHLLIPQIENLVRWQLKSRNVKTTTLDDQGIENEIGLSALIDRPEIRDIFGEDLTFEFKTLFCDALGPNLRNEVAHGLLEDEACDGISSVYAWWFGLKIVFIPFWNATRTEDEVVNGTEESQ